MQLGYLNNDDVNRMVPSAKKPRWAKGKSFVHDSNIVDGRHKIYGIKLVNAGK